MNNRNRLIEKLANNPMRLRAKFSISISAANRFGKTKTLTRGIENVFKSRRQRRLEKKYKLN